MTPTTLLTRHMGGLVFDAIFEEVHTQKLSVMSHPTAGGLFLADHITLEPAHVRITAGVSDTPLTTHRAADPFATGPRSVQAFELLGELQRKGEPFDVQTGLKLYKNMVCASLQVKQDKIHAHVLYFQAELTQVQYGTLNQLVRLAPGPIFEQASQLVDWGFRHAEIASITQKGRFF